MKVIIDEREHGLFEKCQLILQSQKNASYVILSKEVLQLGDIFITTDDNKPLIIIERKTFSDQDLNEMLKASKEAIKKIIQLQKSCFEK